MAKETTENTTEKQRMTGEAFIEKYSKILGAVVVLIIIGVAGVYLMRIQKGKKDSEAQAEIFQAQFYFEQDSLDLALNGDGRNLGLLDIIDLYGGTDAGNLANFYIGSIYLQKGQFAEAVDHLENFTSSEDIVQARAYALTGDAYMEQQQYDDAESKYLQAADRVDDEFFSPGYLMKAALAAEKKSDYKSAIKSLGKVVEKYKKSAEYNDARKHKARLEALSAS